MDLSLWLRTVVVIMLAALAVAAVDAAGSTGMTLYVSPAGNDQWSGRLAQPNRTGTDGPVATLSAARDAVRALKAKEGLPPGGITVLVAAGTYDQASSFALTAEDSGSPSRPVTYRAAPGAIVRLTGGHTLPPSSFAPLADPAIRARLKPEVADRVVVADLKAAGVGPISPIPARYRGAPAVPELFCNDQRMTVAHWPNEGWAEVARIIASGSIPRSGDKGTDTGIFEYTEDQPSRWKVDEGVWLQGYWCFDWFDETIRVRAIDPATKQITLDQPTVYGVKQGNPSPRRYKALNVLEELEAPGEYYFDIARMKLYFYPPAPLAQARIALSLLNAPIVQLTDASYVALRGFVVENGLGPGITVSDGRGVRIEACEVRNVREVGIKIEGGLGHKVTACDIHHTGTGGVVLSGGDRKTLTAAGHEAVNCHVWEYSEHQLTYANAFLIHGVGNRVAHCLIHDAPHQAIGVGGNDHIFEYNEVHHICTETDDCGAYYKGRNPSCRGNIVRYNFFHNIGSPMGHGNAAVYFDDGDGGDQVIGNIFFRCGDPGKGSFGTVFSHGGFDLLAENNIFIECKRPLGSSPWPYKRYMDFLKDPQYRKLLVTDVDITQPPYTTRYPELVDFLTMPETRVRTSKAVGNVLTMCGAVSSGNWQVGPEENWITSEDPGFVNAAAGNFALRPDAPVFRKLPGFKPIPFAEIGLYKDELRPTLPAKTWTYPAPRQLEPLSKTVAAATQARQKAAPVFKVAATATPPTLDGQLDATEYGGGRPEQAMLLAQDVMGTPTKRTSRAWLTYDSKALYLLVDNNVHPETKLTGNQWGGDDAVEVALLKPQPGKRGPLYVLRGYGNGRVEFGTAPNPDEEPLTMDPGGIVYKVTTPEKGRWVAEISIPFTMLDLEPATTPKVCFSLTVRKAMDDLWLMWEGTRGHSYDAAQAGIIEFVKPL